MSPAAVRISSAIPFAAPVSAKPAITAGVEPRFVASAVSEQPHGARARSRRRSTGRRPTRSISRPAGTAASPEATRKIAGPSPSSPSTPGDEHERDRRDRRDELQHRRVDRHRRRQQQRVAADGDVRERRAHATVGARSRPGRSGPRWRSGATRSSDDGRAAARRRERSLCSAASGRGAGVADRQARARPARASPRGSRASETVIVPRMPGSSVGQAASETSAQSRPAIAVPGVSTTVGSPAASDAVRQAATSGSTAITGTPAAAPQRAAAAPSEPTPTGTSSDVDQSAAQLGEQRRVAVDHPVRRAGGADVGELEAARDQRRRTAARATASS